MTLSNNRKKDYYKLLKTVKGFTKAKVSVSSVLCREISQYLQMDPHSVDDSMMVPYYGIENYLVILFFSLE